MLGTGNYDNLLKKLGKHSTGKGCLYIKTLKDVDTKVLKELVNASVRSMKSNSQSAS
jgi:hypothetical protein